MNTNPLEQFILPDEINIEEDYDDLCDHEVHQKYGYICLRMQYRDIITGSARYKWEQDHWYIDEFDAYLPDSLPGRGHGTYFLKYLVKEMHQQNKSLIHIVASGLKNPNFPNWLTKRGFKKDKLYFPDKENSMILLPDNASRLLSMGNSY